MVSDRVHSCCISDLFESNVYFSQFSPNTLIRLPVAQDVAQAFQVTAMPTFILLKNMAPVSATLSLVVLLFMFLFTYILIFIISKLVARYYCFSLSLLLS